MSCCVPALSVIVTAPVRVPGPVGVKVTVSVQEAPTARVVGSVPQLFVCAKSPLAAIVLIVKGPVPVLLRVEDCDALVVACA